MQLDHRELLDVMYMKEVGAVTVVSSKRTFIAMDVELRPDNARLLRGSMQNMSIRRN
jgi:hypothetical protein